MAIINSYKRFVEKHPAISFAIYFISVAFGLAGGIFAEIFIIHLGKEYVTESYVRPQLTWVIERVEQVGQELPRTTVVHVKVENTSIRRGTFLVTLTPHTADKIIGVTCPGFTLENVSPKNKNICKVRISNLEPSRKIVLRVALETPYIYNQENKEVVKVHWEEGK